MRCFRYLLFFLSGIKTVCAQTNVPAHVPPLGLVGWWPFSGNAGDSSGQGNHGAVTKAVLAPDRFGRPNAAYSFNGDSSFIEVPDTFSLRLQRLTMAVWVRPQKAGERQQVIYKGRKSDAYGEGYFLHSRGESGIKISSNCQPNVGWRLAYFDPQALPAGTWTHLCTTYDGLYIRNYINGAQADANPITGQIDVCERANLRFGYGQDFYPGPRPFLGQLDEVGLWNRALTPAEVKALYAGSRTPAGMGEGGGVEDDFTLYPNPAHRQVFIRAASATAGGFTVQLTDILGRAILGASFVGGQAVLPLEGLVSRGLHVITIRTQQGKILLRKKLMVE